MRRTPQVDLFLSQLSVGSVVVVSAAGIRQIELAGALYAQLTLQTELSPVPRSRQLARYLRRMRVKVGSGRAGRAVSLAQLIRDYAEISASSVPSHLRTRFESLHLQSLLPFCQVGDSDLDTGRHILTEFRRIRRRMRTIRSTRTLPDHMLTVMMRSQCELLVAEHPDAWRRVEPCLERFSAQRLKC